MGHPLVIRPSAVRSLRAASYITAVLLALSPEAVAKQSSIANAIKSGDLQLVERLLASGSPDDLQAEGLPILLYASGLGQTEVVQLLVRRGANVNATSPSGWTALCLSLQAGREDVANLLVTRGADVSKRCPSGDMPQTLAARKGFLDAEAAIKERGGVAKSVEDPARSFDLSCRSILDVVDSEMVYVVQGRSAPAVIRGPKPFIEGEIATVYQVYGRLALGVEKIQPNVLKELLSHCAGTAGFQERLRDNRPGLLVIDGKKGALRLRVRDSRRFYESGSWYIFSSSIDIQHGVN